MAQWSRADRTLYTKVVYYGPALGGKTTNLESLHRLTDPDGANQLVTLQTGDDRTLFFDLLPFDLGEILGHQVGIKLYTVPGQVRYDATRQVVLGGADAVLFVADSARGREEQNRWSLQNLRMNMRAKRLDPAHVPVVYQFNKQDLDEAASPDEVGRWLGLSAGEGFPATAIHDEGVLEAFMAVSRTMLERLIAQADPRTRKQLDPSGLQAQVDRAFAPHLARLRGGHTETAEPPPRVALVLEDDELLQQSICGGLELGERLTTATARAARLERETRALSRISSALTRVGASFERGEILGEGLSAVREILGVPVVSLVRRNADGALEAETVCGAAHEPLLQADDGRDLLDRLIRGAEPERVVDLAGALGASRADLSGLRLAASVPVEPEGVTSLVAYAAQPDGEFGSEDLGFLATVAEHLAVGIEKARLYAEVAAQRDLLEETVERRTAELRAAYEELRGLEETKDRFLGNLSHEMKTPLTAILSSAVCMRDYDVNDPSRAELTETIAGSADTLCRMMDDLFRAVATERDDAALTTTETSSADVLLEALALSGRGEVVKLDRRGDEAPLRVDATRLARALANLIDNAVKFSGAGEGVEVRVRATRLGDGHEGQEVLVFRVLDRGPGVQAEDRQRIFEAFEQGGDPLNGKPAGCGLGLHEARSIARRHGGGVDCRARRGGGSEFRLWVPLVRVGRAVALVGE